MECRLWPMNQILLQLNEIITSKEMGVKGDTWVILNSVLFGRCKVKSKDLATNMDTGWWLSHREQVSILIPVCCAQPHPTLFDPMDYSPPGFSVHGILQARVLEWVAISSSWGLPDPGIEPTSPESPALQQADSLPTELPGKPLHVCMLELNK